MSLTDAFAALAGLRSDGSVRDYKLALLTDCLAKQPKGAADKPGMIRLPNPDYGEMVRITLGMPSWEDVAIAVTMILAFSSHRADQGLEVICRPLRENYVGLSVPLGYVSGAILGFFEAGNLFHDDSGTFDRALPGAFASFITSSKLGERSLQVQPDFDYPSDIYRKRLRAAMREYIRGYRGSARHATVLEIMEVAAACQSATLPLFGGTVVNDLSDALSAELPALEKARAWAAYKQELPVTLPAEAATAA